MKRIKNLTGVIALGRDQQRKILGGHRDGPIPEGSGGGGAGYCENSSQTCNTIADCPGCYSCDWHPNEQIKVCWT